MFRLSMQYYKRFVDCSDLSLKWHGIASEYTKIWENVYSDDAAGNLEAVDMRVIDLGKPAIATGHPDKKRIAHWWNYVLDRRSIYV